MVREECRRGKDHTTTEVGASAGTVQEPWRVPLSGVSGASAGALHSGAVARGSVRGRQNTVKVPSRILQKTLQGVLSNAFPLVHFRG